MLASRTGETFLKLSSASPFVNVTWLLVKLQPAAFVYIPLIEEADPADAFVIS